MSEAHYEYQDVVRYEVADLDLETVKRLHREALAARELRQMAAERRGVETPTELLAIEDAVERMPDEDLDKARVIYKGLAESDFVLDRDLAATSLPRLARHDWEAARPLWRNLLLDDAAKVWDAAREELRKAIAEQTLPAAQLAELVDDIVETLWSLRGQDNRSEDALA